MIYDILISGISTSHKLLTLNMSAEIISCVLVRDIRAPHCLLVYCQKKYFRQLCNWFYWFYLKDIKSQNLDQDSQKNGFDTVDLFLVVFLI